MSKKKFTKGLARGWDNNWDKSFKSPGKIGSAQAPYNFFQDY